MAILPRRRAAEPSKEQALADARKATAKLRRSILKARRHQSGKQDNPVDEMTPNQWLGGSVH
jgi:Cdc6-like AAA superfamily ATPase